MLPAPTFTINYWGTTGSYPSPLKPDDVAAKIQQALRHLAQHGRLQELARIAQNEAQLQVFVAQYLPQLLGTTHGGNTTCVEVQTPDALCIIDCGTGLRELGTELERRWNSPDYHGPREGHILLTHPHMDHISAIPFFDPFLDQRNRFTLYGSTAVLTSLDAIFSAGSQLSNLYYPITFQLLKAIRQRVPLIAGDRFTIGATTISTLPLRHPGGCMGFRFDCRGKAFVFCTDHEHNEAPDPALVEFSRGADLLYLDGQYLAAEYEGRAGIMGEPPLVRRGWGHSTIEACTTTAVAAGVGQIHIGHREPKRDDADMVRIEAYFQQCLADALARQGRDGKDCLGSLAYEGMSVTL